MSLINPYFRVTSWPKARPLMAEFEELCIREPSFSHFGWTRSGDELLWRTAFADVDTMLTSFRSLSPLIDKMLEGAATMDRVEVHGPAAALDRIRQKTSQLGASYIETDNQQFQSGFVMKSTDKEVDQKNPASTDAIFSITDWPTARPIMQKYFAETSEVKK
jgi:hypothetical protein